MFIFFKNVIIFDEFSLTKLFLKLEEMQSLKMTLDWKQTLIWKYMSYEWVKLRTDLRHLIVVIIDQRYMGQKIKLWLFKIGQLC